MRPWFWLLLAQAYFVCLARCDGIIGVGGFVREAASIARGREAGRPKLDFSSVTVELFNAEGVKRYSTECAPNGYYFIPVEDTGRLVLRVRGAQGWSFEPSEVTVTCQQGEPCNGGQDVDFEFTAFSIHGRVAFAPGWPDCKAAGAGSRRSVQLALRDEAGAELQRVTARADGSFVLQQVLPGRYTVAALHQRWSVTPAEQTIDVFDNGAPPLPEPFQLSGFALTGRIAFADGRPVAGVEVSLEKVHTESSHSGAAPTMAAATVATDEQGRFHLADLTCGSFALEAQHRRGGQAFTLEPRELLVDMPQNDLDLGAAFRIVGFSMPGRVLHADGTSGVAGATVRLRGEGGGREVEVRTDGSGAFLVESVGEGVAYDIEVAAPHVSVPPARTPPMSADLRGFPDLIVQRYALCGRLVVSDARFRTLRDVLATHATSGTHRATAEADGSFCFRLSPGRYSLQPQVTDAERRQGLAFGPSSADVELAHDNRPQLGITFLQARLTLTAKLLCADGSCNSGVTITLQPAAAGAAAVVVPIGASSLPEGVRKNVREADVEVEFSGLSPGSYALRARGEAVCFAPPQVDVTLGASNATAPDIVQAGYVVKVSSSHATALQLLQPDGTSATLAIPQGSSTFCTSSAGTHTLLPTGCFRFGEEPVSFATGAEAGRPPAAPAVSLRASHMRVHGSIRAADADVPLQRHTVQFEVPPDAPVQLTAALPGGCEGAGCAESLEYEHWVSISAAQVSAVPDAHPQVLFHPPQGVSRRLLPGSCPEPLPAIEAHTALFLSGSTSPPVPGASVVITVAEPSRHETRYRARDAVAEVALDAEGRFEYGPLWKDGVYSVAISHEGYDFASELQGPTTWAWSTQRHTAVTVVVDVPGPDKEGVLVSLSGDNGFRKNAASDADGKVVFWKLPAGSYYLRPNLREYRFEPAAASLDLTGQDDQQVEFAATRVAWSVTGATSSLNGAPMEGVIVAAAPDDDGGSVESAQSDRMGQFRIRGLQAGVRYRLSVWSSRLVERAFPAQQDVVMPQEDVRDVNFTVFRAQQRARIAALISAPDAVADYVAVELWQGGVDTGSLERSVDVDYSRYVELSGLRPGDYVLRAACHSQPQTVTCHGSQAVVKVAQGSQHTVRLAVHGGAVDAVPADAASSPLPVLFTIGLAVLFFQRQALLSWIASFSQARSGSAHDDAWGAAAASRKPPPKAKRI